MFIQKYKSATCWSKVRSIILHYPVCQNVGSVANMWFANYGSKSVNCGKLKMSWDVLFLAFHGTHG